MRKRPLGKTGLSVTELSLGTWGLCGDGYGPVAEAEQDRVIERAAALGITLFETADSYAHGAMERRLGERLSDPKRTRIVTKIGTDLDSAFPKKCFKVDYLEHALARSQERLKRDAIDVVLLHNPSTVALERGDATSWLDEQKTAGRVRAWGVSAGSEDVAREAIARGADVVSLAFNAFSRAPLRGLQEDVQREDVGILAHSVLAYGLLAAHWGASKEFSDGDHRAERWTQDELRQRVRQLDALRPLVGGNVMTMRAGALRYVLANSLVSSAVLGPRSSLQLDQLVREAGKGTPYLAPDALSALEARLEEVGAT
jgi:aryl-alcohol dehydrogenase-like predicted oxidoreductase